MTGGRFYDIKANHEKREYYVVARHTGEVDATYRYKSELDRGRAAGRAEIHRLELNREIERKARRMLAELQADLDANFKTKGE